MKYPAGNKIVYLAATVIVIALPFLQNLPARQSQTSPLGPDDAFTVAVNTSTIEASPVFVAHEAAGGGFRVVDGGVRNLASGTAHAATNAETQMLNVIQSNPGVRLLFTLSEGLYRIIARRSAGIRSLQDLRGKRITTIPNTSAHYHLVRMLSTVGLKETDVTIVNVGATEMAAAVANRQADAISMWEPEAQNALEALGSDAIVFQDNKAYRELFSLYTTTDVLNDAKRRRELTEFVRALLAAADKTRRMPTTVIPLVAKAIGQPEDKVSRSWRFHSFPASMPANVLDVLTEEEQWVARAQQRSPLSRGQLAGFIDDSILREAGVQ